MRAIMVMFDSLNRHFLPPYGNDWVKAPNFARLAERCATFNNSYIGSSPTIPTRRELHTGRYNFLHRNWGPLEPFDDSMPEILKKNGVYTHLCVDCHHYWDDGGMTYHGRYGTAEFARGQEGDLWKGDAGPKPDIPEKLRIQDPINRRYMTREEDMPQSQTFANGLAFMRDNVQHDSWFLQIESFDPHEPYFVPQKYIDLYPHDYDGPEFDWPDYARVNVPPEQVEHVRFMYAALLSMCDANLGRVLDFMDENKMWDDTMLIVNTDHGFMLGEHGWFAKMRMPFYNEIAHTPLFVWDPRSKVAGERRQSLVQAIDWAPTLLEFFDQGIPQNMQGVALRDTIADDTPVREAGLFGMFREHVNVTDGRYVYMRAPVGHENAILYNYTLMPGTNRNRYPVSEMRFADMVEPFAFTKGCPLMRVPALNPRPKCDPVKTLLFDLEQSPTQEETRDDPAIEGKMIEHLVRLMTASDAPGELFPRLGL